MPRQTVPGTPIVTHGGDEIDEAEVALLEGEQPDVSLVAEASSDNVTESAAESTASTEAEA